MHPHSTRRPGVPRAAVSVAVTRPPLPTAPVPVRRSISSCHQHALDHPTVPVALPPGFSLQYPPQEPPTGPHVSRLRLLSDDSRSPGPIGSAANPRSPSRKTPSRQGRVPPGRPSWRRWAVVRRRRPCRRPTLRTRRRTRSLRRRAGRQRGQKVSLGGRGGWGAPGWAPTSAPVGPAASGKSQRSLWLRVSTL